MSSFNERKGHPILRTVFVLLLVAVIGLGGWIGFSVKRIGDLLGQASTAYEKVQTCVESEDYDNALIYARTAASLTSQVSSELDGVQWDIASHIPVLGEDVSTMRSVGRISGTLADDAVLPALDSWDKLVGEDVLTDGEIDANKVVGKIEQFGDLALSLQNAGKVVDECSVEADALPTSHFGTINEWVGQLRETIASVDGIFDQFGAIIDLVANLTTTLSSLSSAG